MTSNSADTSAGIDMSGIFAPFFWGFFVSILHICTFLIRVIGCRDYAYFGPNILSPRSAIIVLLLGSLITSLSSQMYFVYQIYSASTVIGVLTLFAVLTFVGGIGCVATMYVFAYGVLADRNEDFAIFFGLAKGFGAVTDIMATLAMCTFLSNAKTGIRQTDNLIKSLIQYVVERGGVVTLIQTLLLITFYAAPTKLYWLAFHINVTKLYANTFFCMLNARKGLWEKHAANNRATAMVSSIVTNGIEFRSTRSEGISTCGRSYALTPIDDQKSYPDIIDMPTITKTVIVSTA
ncbi:hypothetical protein F5879DRAFT_923604 [Lentinula edodes]|nr:hypothetical protein F5879DRAFT_923604 [Lentinula edodes]